MKKIYIIVSALAFFIIIGLALITTSQSAQVTMSLDAPSTCHTDFYNDNQPVYSSCTNYINSTRCLNTTGPNTACSALQTQSIFTCQTGLSTTVRNSTTCNSLNKFIVSINNGGSTNNQEIDFSNWGVCVNSTENGCMAITCGNDVGGSAHNGIFNGCDGGKSCQKFLFCPDGTRKILYKASRSDFVQEDPTFKLNPLVAKEVGP